jgi:hypothetical protein
MPAVGLSPNEIKSEATLSWRTESPTHQHISIPEHKSVNIGTLTSILRAVASHKGVSREEILESID